MNGGIARIHSLTKAERERAADMLTESFYDYRLFTDYYPAGAGTR